MSFDTESAIVGDGLAALTSRYSPVDSNDLAPAVVLRQLRGIGSLFVYQTINGLEAMSKADQGRLILQGLCGHASSKTASVLDMICQGEGPGASQLGVAGILGGLHPWSNNILSIDFASAERQQQGSAAVRKGWQGAHPQ